MNKRNKIKRAFLISGLAAVLPGLVLFLINTISMDKGQVSVNIVFGIIMIAGLFPLSAAFLMHAKDIRESKRAMSVALTVLAWVWMGCGAIILIAKTMSGISFG